MSKATATSQITGWPSHHYNSLHNYEYLNNEIENLESDDEYEFSDIISQELAKEKNLKIDPDADFI